MTAAAARRFGFHTMDDSSDHIHVALQTGLSPRHIADLFAAVNWQIRKCGWAEYELRPEWGELVIEDASPVLIHGAVDDALDHIDELLGPLRTAGISFVAECYGPGGKLLRELRSAEER